MGWQDDLRALNIDMEDPGWFFCDVCRQFVHQRVDEQHRAEDPLHQSGRAQPRFTEPVAPTPRRPESIIDPPEWHPSYRPDVWDVPRMGSPASVMSAGLFDGPFFTDLIRGPAGLQSLPGHGEGIIGANVVQCANVGLERRIGVCVVREPWMPATTAIRRTAQVVERILSAIRASSGSMLFDVQALLHSRIAGRPDYESDRGLRLPEALELITEVAVDDGQNPRWWGRDALLTRLVRALEDDLETVCVQSATWNQSHRIIYVHVIPTLRADTGALLARLRHASFVWQRDFAASEIRLGLNIPNVDIHLVTDGRNR